MGQRGLFKHSIDQLPVPVEDFEKAQEMFHLLWSLLDGVKGQGLLIANVLRFLDTLEVIHVIHDLPFSSTLSVKRQTGKPQKCINYADTAYHYAMEARSGDRKAWALAIKAFGLEGLGRYQEAEKGYKSSLRICEAEKGDARVADKKSKIPTMGAMLFQI